MARHAGIVGDAVAQVPETGQSDLWRLAAPLWSVDEPTEDDAIHAEAVIGRVQGIYRERDALAENEARSVVAIQELAIRIVTRRMGGSSRRAKEAQLQASHGEPLAVCVGTLTVDWVRFLDGSTVIGRRHGCGAVFPDTVRTSGHVWATTCPECRAKRSERRRSAVRSTKRLLGG